MSETIDGPQEWEERPNGCPDDEHWKECYRKGHIGVKGMCNHPTDYFVNIRDGMPICHHRDNKVHVEKFRMRKEQ